MNKYIFGGLVTLAIVLFFVGRYSGHQPEPDTTVVDSLVRYVSRVEKERDGAIILLKQYQSSSKKLYAAAVESQKQKQSNQITYEKAVTVLDSYTPDQLDSAIWARHPELKPIVFKNRFKPDKGSDGRSAQGHP